MPIARCVCYSLLAFLTFLSTTGFADDDAKPEESGEIALFDGESTDGWTSADGGKIGKGWQVEDGVLGLWDTTAIPDGQYTLALAVWGENDPSNPYLFFITNLTVDNSQLEPTPEEPTPDEPLPTVEAGPTRTPISVQQPATPTARPSPTLQEGEEPEGSTPVPEDDEGTSVLPDTSGLRGAFCTGGLITLMLFLLWALYTIAKASIRWYLRESSRPRGS